LWKSGKDKKQTAAQLLIDVTAQVTKRLAETIMDVIDLSLIRSVVEIFFRPVEGSLTLKSNRFLKLEAGNNECKMPTEAFSAEGQKKMQDAIDKAAIKDAKGIGDGMIEIFNVTATLVLNHYQYFANKYNSCIKDLQKVNAAISDLRVVANTKTTAENLVKVCKIYEDLKNDLWNQEKDEDWNEDKFGFTDEVASKEKTEIPVESILHIRNVTKARWDRISDVQKGSEISSILGSRKFRKEKVVTAYNQLRKHIYELQHHTPTEQDIAIAFGHLKSATIPEDYQKKVLAAFDPKKLNEVPLYTQVDEILTDLDSEFHGEMNASDDEVKLLRRLVIINLLEELGFVDSARTKLNAQGRPDPKGTVPPKPTAKTLNDDTWAAYVNSLSGVPPIDALKKTTLGGALKDALSSAWEDQKDKMKFWKGISERKNWSDGKNGQILFATSENTFSMKDNGIIEEVTSFESSTSKPSDANNIIGDKNKKSLEGYVEKLRKALRQY
jgi:hypothetical protein